MLASASLPSDRAGNAWECLMGLQVQDQLGRVHLILEKPSGGWLSNVVFGGSQLDTLYVTCGTQVFHRKVNATGVVPARGRVTPPRPRL